MNEACGIRINTDDLPAMRGQSPGERAATTAYVQRPPAGKRKRARHETVVMSIVIPAHLSIFDDFIGHSNPAGTLSISGTVLCGQSPEGERL